jgi:hypothetical protein
VKFEDDCIVDAVPDCRCMCCMDMRERRRCNAWPFRNACNCHEYAEPEQCDCELCRRLLAERRKPS